MYIDIRKGRRIPCTPALPLVSIIEHRNEIMQAFKMPLT